MIRLSGLNLYMKKLEMEEEGFIPIGLDAGKTQWAKIRKKEQFRKYALFLPQRLT